MIMRRLPIIVVGEKKILQNDIRNYKEVLYNDLKLGGPTTIKKLVKQRQL